MVGALTQHAWHAKSQSAATFWLGFQACRFLLPLLHHRSCVAQTDKHTHSHTDKHGNAMTDPSELVTILIIVTVFFLFKGPIALQLSEIGCDY